jgi:uncharacterized protein (TIGR02996 family)
MLDEAPFLATIRDNPADDGPRCVFLDWLEERGQRTWPRILNYVLRFPHDDAMRLLAACYWEQVGETDRGQFIRVQCKLASLEQFAPSSLRAAAEHNDGSCCVVGCEYCELRGRVIWLRRRERELFRDSGPKWWNDTPGSYRETRETADGCRITAAEGWQYEVRRGFIEVVRCRLEQWVGEPCARCGGHGHTYKCPTCNCHWRLNAPTATQPDGSWSFAGPSEQPGRCCDNASMVAVESHPIECLACNGTGQAVGLAESVCQVAPVLTVAAADKRPVSEDGSLWWVADAGLNRNRPEALPDAFEFQPLLGVAFESAEGANTALSDVLVNHGRVLASLEPI